MRTPPQGRTEQQARFCGVRFWDPVHRYHPDQLTGDVRMKPLSILYVEDNTDLRDTLSELLEGPGRTVVAVATGEAALEAWQSGASDVLVTDISLPGMSGTALARLLLAKNPAQWVVLCSGYVYGDYLARLGPNVRTLPKPFELEQLEALLDEINAALNPP